MSVARRMSLVVVALLVSVPAAAQVRGGAERGPDDGDGPYERLIIRGAIVIDGTGAPPRGPVDIVIEGNRIEEIRGVGTPNVPLSDEGRPTGATREIDAEGWYVLPGFVNLHAHGGEAPKSPDATYPYKLWLAHGITTVRGVALGSMDWTLAERERSARNEIVAPRIVAYHRPGTGEGWSGGPIRTPETARAWVRWAAGRGIDGLKLGSHPPAIMEALLDEAAQQGLGSTAHLAQTGVAQMNALDAARMGLGTVTHFYGLFEALYNENDVQPWPVDMNYSDEQHRFGQVAQQWNLIHPPGSEEWKAFLQELLDLNVVLDPTMTAYLAGRDVMRERTADWHQTYTLPSLWDFYEPSRENHGSYFYDWTTWEEVAWRNFFRQWMTLLNDYKNMGGRVTVSADAAFIYNLWGFGSIEEMELLQEAGFHPLEVLRGATMHGAEAIFEPKAMPIEYGVVREGMLADLVLIEENPVANLKVLYGTGTLRLNDETGRVERVGGINYTIKDGIVYDARQLLEDVRDMVEAQKAERAAASSGSR